MEQTSKTCRRCGLTKLIEEYSTTTSKGKIYRRNICKSCTNRTGGRIYSPNKNINSIESKPLPFTEIEITVLKDIVNQYLTQPTLKQIFNEILNLNDRESKTYTMNISLLSEIKDFCNEYRISKSDLINIAVKEFLKNNKNKKIF
jgi:hypothetical protein